MMIDATVRLTFTVPDEVIDPLCDEQTRQVDDDLLSKALTVKLHGKYEPFELYVTQSHWM